MSDQTNPRTTNPNITLYQLKGECLQLMRAIWNKHPKPWKNRLRAWNWVEGHIGKDFSHANEEELLLLERLLFEKQRDGRCSMHLGKETRLERRKKLIGSVARYKGLREQIIAERGLVCENCHRTLLTTEVTIDHVIPVFLGGPTTKENLKILCHTPCHRNKSRRENRQARLINLENLERMRMEHGDLPKLSEGD